jgi:SP family general alpha glucoside:H+ symporter-like MFS transporter
MATDKGLTMESTAVIPTEQELKGFDLANPEIVELIHHAQESDAADRLLTIRQALKKYKKAVFWAMFLSTSLIMEGYDLVIVSSFSANLLREDRNGTLIP